MQIPYKFDIKDGLEVLTDPCHSARCTVPNEPVKSRSKKISKRLLALLLRVGPGSGQDSGQFCAQIQLFGPKMSSFSSRVKFITKSVVLCCPKAC